MGNTFGKKFKITSWGESHGPAVGVTLDGVPSLFEINIEHIQNELQRRKPGQSEISTQRKEEDSVEILSGIFEGKTTGAPISMLIRNTDQRSKDYDHIKNIFRPSHADYTYQAKYGIRDWKGGGRASARETIARVASGAVAKQWLSYKFNTEIFAFVKQISNLKAAISTDNITKKEIESNIVRCPDNLVANKMIQKIKDARKNGDSLGGIIECVTKNIPVGLGEPVFDKLDADLAKAILSIPACKGFEIGSGFAGVEMTGSEHNDEFYVDDDNTVKTKTNHSGGVQGGISNGENIILRAAFKPTATIIRSQKTIDTNHNTIEMQGKGRHDPCVLPRAVPIVESMVALVIADHALLNHSNQ
ncbi:MAG: chorismate synthase [SAR202 cluster bacterium]|nr:chorismate synthase [SAR202 cluster bacterium]|tara:strand:+ start:49416 stop:50495 length:1080 start_codon:yes stop_codon:yes gene_type:complete